jgi:molybdate transport system substrate-binding protein
MPAAGTNIHVFSGAAPKDALLHLAAEFERATDHQVTFTFQLVSETLKSLAAGQKADLILLPLPLIGVAEKTIPLRTEGRKAFARVGIGVIVREGVTLPDISSEESVRQALLNASAIVLDNPSTPNGEYLGRMMARLGITEQVAPKTIARAPIEGGAELVAKGEAELGFFLASEVRNVKGTTLVGSLPSSLNNFVVFGSAIPAYNSLPEPATAFVQFISDSTSSRHWAAGGFELLEH